MKLSRPGWWAFLGLLAVVVLAVLFWPKKPPPPEEIIRRQVIQIARAAEKKDLGFILDQASETFHSEQLGNKSDLKSFLAALILRGQWVRVWVVDTQISLSDPQTAEFVGKFVLGRSEASKVEDLGKDSNVSARRVEAMSKREADGQWRFVSAKERELSPAELMP